MAPAAAPKQVSEPFPISCVAGRYLLFDVDVISHVRRNHNICGILVGTIPNLSQQNVFLGIPLELLPEEARVLVEGGHAHIVDDVETHRQGFQEMSRADRLKYLAEMDRQGTEAAKESLAAQEKKKDVALKKKGLRKDMVEAETAPSVADSTATIESAATAPSVADSTASDATVHVELPSPASSGLGFIMKGSGFLDSQSSVKTISTSAPSESSDSVASDFGSSFIDLGSIMKGSSFMDSVSTTSKPDIAVAPASAASLSPQTSDLGSSFSDLGSIMKGSSFLDPTPIQVKVRKVEVEEAAPLLVKEEAAELVEADSTQLEAAMQEEFSAVTAADPKEAELPEAIPPMVDSKPTPASNPQDASTPTSLFDSQTTTTKSTSKSVFAQRQYITPTTSHPPLPTPSQDPSRPLPAVPKSYPLFRFLHSRGYFFMPGLRFGCNYSVYPGDPLRYHSHFLATGLGWDEKFELLDIVGGGRLGTGTKKAYMVGGQDEGNDGAGVRAFSVEWASM
ncbi:tRNA intron endonuclease [Stagonosporopsis vannaccii]|nr:tRNA intron endonuclease [Stagonosporopsis vannaccii]